MNPIGQKNSGRTRSLLAGRNRALGENRGSSRPRQIRVTANAIVNATIEPNEIDRQLPVGDEIFLDHVAHFVRDAGRRAAGAGPLRFRADADLYPGQSRSFRRTTPDRNRQRHRDVRARIHGSAVQDRRYAACPRVRCDAGRARGTASCGFCRRRCASRAPAARRERLSCPRSGQHVAAGRHRSRRRHGGVHDRARRTRRDAGGPHPDADPSHRADGVAEAVAHVIRTARSA